MGVSLLANSAHVLLAAPSANVVAFIVCSPFLPSLEPYRVPLLGNINFYGKEHDVQSHMLRPTITDMQDKYCGECYDIYLIQFQYAKVAAFGRHHKRGGAAFCRATSFVASFVLALNKVNIVAVTTILVLHVGNGPKMHFQGRETGCLGSGVFVIPRETHVLVLLQVIAQGSRPSPTSPQT